MDRKLQVFISSTQTDLLEERQAAVMAVLQAGHIPAGMELFAAGDKSQMEVIKRWIDESDVYMLILGARYGSIESSSGQSYTELEYDYAMSLGKPLFSVVLNDQAVREKRESGLVTADDDAWKGPLDAFRKRVQQKTAPPVAGAQEVAFLVLRSMQQIVADYGERLSGWVRPLDRDPELLAAARALEQENRALKAELTANPLRSLAPFDSTVSITIISNYKPPYAQREPRRHTVDRTWGQIFGIVWAKALANATDAHLRAQLAQRISGLTDDMNAQLLDEQWEAIMAHFLALGLVQAYSGGGVLCWYLTPKGSQAGAALRATYAPSAGSGSPAPA